jgi:hypothetical protein
LELPKWLSSSVCNELCENVEVFASCRQQKAKRWGLGRCYVVGAKGVIDKNVDLEKLARDLKASEPRETLK